MAWIKNRIESEHRKYKTFKSKHLEWSKIAEIKILGTIKEIIDDIDRKTFDISCNKNRPNFGVGAITFKKMLVKRLGIKYPRLSYRTERKSNG